MKLHYGSWLLKIINILLFVSIFVFQVNGEVFTALVDMEKLIEIEKLIVSSLDDYLIALSRLLRPRNSITGQFEIEKFRTSKSAWLIGSDHEVIDRVNQRIEDITGLTVDTAEDLHVINYGIGGHYVPHYDFYPKSQMANHQFGNRIATWLNYMSDVEAGGATVFPELDLTLWPEKGSAAFWYNLRPSGDSDMFTLHAACPVLFGTKWASNKWFGEYGQEFRRPCGLNRSD